MAGVPRSLEKYNAREQLLSADMMRAQFLASRDDQNLESWKTASIDCADPASPNSQIEMLSVNGVPIYGVDLAPTWNPAAGYTSTIGAGQGYIRNGAFVGLTADDSSYLTTRWPSTVVTFANPPGANQRIDVVVATPAMVDADSQSRQTLIDPVTRAISPANVFKTSNPLATVSVITGTAGATPAIPTIPAGALPLFLVWVKTGDATAANFAVCRASWRRAPHPFSSVSAVLSGMGMLWDLTADPAAASAAVIAKGFHRVVIDGEVLEFYANLDSTVGGFLPDTSNNPFTAAAPATWHKPYYIYAVGGRNNMKPSYNTADGLLSPVTLVESLTPPNPVTGRPTTGITVGGTGIGTNAAVYIGLGFVAANTTRRLACIMDEEFTTFGSTNSGHQQIAHTRAAPGVAELVGAPTSKPSISSRARVTMLTTAAGGAQGNFALMPDGGGGAVAPSFSYIASGVVQQWNPGSGALVTSNGLLVWPVGANANVWLQGGQTGDGVAVFFLGYNHRVKAFGSLVNP